MNPGSNIILDSNHLKNVFDEISNDLFIVRPEDCAIQYLNQNAANRFILDNKDRPVKGEMKFTDLLIPDSIPKVVQILEKSNFENQHYQATDCVFRDKNGNECPSELKVFLNLQQANPFFTIISNHLQEVENDDYQKLLQKNEALLKEIHHRVKNNLQIVTSILALQDEFVQSKDAKDILTASQARISAMALVHELLYEIEGIRKINYQNYIDALLTELGKVNRAESMKLDYKYSAENINLNLDTSIPLGLLLTEIVTNSINHAFSDMEKGQIKISIEHLGENDYFMLVVDNGCGFNVNNTPKNLGMNLIETLVKQLKGQLDITHDNGTKYCIKFKEID